MSREEGLGDASGPSQKQCPSPLLKDTAGARGPAEPRPEVSWNQQRRVLAPRPAKNIKVLKVVGGQRNRVAMPVAA